MASLKRWLDLKRNPWKAPLHKGMKAWKRDKAQFLHLYSYDTLPERPIVLDVGGFEGGWSDIVLEKRPDAHIHIFEPHPVFAKSLRDKFGENPNISVHEYAIGSKQDQISLSDAADASSAFGLEGQQGYSAEVRPVSEFFQATNLGEVDLAKINIEAGEYDLIPAIINDGLIGRIKRLQVQFHLFEPSMEAERNSIRIQLQKTHECVWCYPFVWEE